MAKWKKNDFEKICDNLEEKNILGQNEITFVRKYFISDLKIHEDKDMLLKIKTEAEASDYNVFLTSTLNILMMFFAAFGVMINLLPQMPDMPEIQMTINLVKIVYLLLIIIFVIIPVEKMVKAKSDATKKWRKYVLVVINELVENESEKMEHDSKAEQRERQNINTSVKSTKNKRRIK